MDDAAPGRAVALGSEGLGVAALVERRVASPRHSASLVRRQAPMTAAMEPVERLVYQDPNDAGRAQGRGAGAGAVVTVEPATAPMIATAREAVNRRSVARQGDSKPRPRGCGAQVATANDGCCTGKAFWARPGRSQQMKQLLQRTSGLGFRRTAGDCDVTLADDRAVSRKHAELVVEPAAEEGGATALSVRDFSRVGTFVNRGAGAPPGSAAPGGLQRLADGDTVTFGAFTKFRVRYVPLHICVSEYMEETQQSSISLGLTKAGVGVLKAWRPECTHLVVDDGQPMSMEVAVAIANRSCIALLDRRRLSDPLPSEASNSSSIDCSFAASVQLLGNEERQPGEGLVKVAPAELRKGLLQSTTFLLGDRALCMAWSLALLEAADARVEDLGLWQPSSQVSTIPSQRSRIWLRAARMPESGLDNTEEPVAARHLRWVDEVELVRAVLLAFKDWPTLVRGPSAASQAIEASEDTQEAGEALEEAQADTAGTSGTRALLGAESRGQPVQDVAKGEGWMSSQRGLAKMLVHAPESAPHTPAAATPAFRTPEPEAERRSNQARNALRKPSDVHNTEDAHKHSSHEEPKHDPASKGTGRSSAAGLVEPKQEAESAAIVEDGGPVEVKADITYSQIVVNPAQPAAAQSEPDTKNTPNFKRFKKVTLGAAPGNSFEMLVPFAKEAYRKSNLGRELEAFAASEKKRKQRETAAEELFQAEKVKRQKASGVSGLERYLGPSGGLLQG
eukprot:SM000073S21394  [mRNA]  locus=s73:6917:11959:+ [translate_table: standard]